jgi:hypothetical protein
LDFADLDRLDRFAASLRPQEASPESITHPYRLYALLCQAARLYINSSNPPASVDLTLVQNQPNSLGDFDFTQYGVEAGPASNQILEPGGPQTYDLSDWFYGNQQMMSLLDEDVTF